MDDRAAISAVLTPPQLKRFVSLCEIDGPIEPRFDGFTKHVLLTQDRAFLFPRNHTVVRQLKRECDIYAAVDHSLVPCLLGEWCDAEISPYPFFAVTRLAGRPVVAMNAEAIASLAAQLGMAMAGYHGTPVERLPSRLKKDPAAEAMGRPHYTPIRFLGGIGHIAGVTSTYLDVSKSATAKITEALEAADAMAPVLAHGDLHEAQILVDESGALMGILDWGFAGVISPLCDFVCSQFKGESLDAESSYGDMRRHMWSVYAEHRAAPLPTWEQVHIALTAFDITALAPDTHSHYYWHQGEKWRAARRAAAGDCLRTML